MCGVVAIVTKNTYTYTENFRYTHEFLYLFHDVVEVSEGRSVEEFVREWRLLY